MNTYQVTERDQKRAESIRRQYIPREENKMEQLQKLDNKVKLPGKDCRRYSGNYWGFGDGCLACLW